MQSDIKLPMYGRIIQLRYHILFVEKVSREIATRWPQHVEISLEKEPLDTFPAKKKYPALSKSAINSYYKLYLSNS